jgi:hypothetical protein
MGRITSITAACCAAALLSAAPAAAQNANRLTYVTFSGPVSLPGTTLPAGTYAFRLADSPADRHIVQVFNRDETKLFTTLLAVPAERNQAEGEPVITFKETPSDRPPAVRYWYYAGEKAGNEFVYPKNQAMMIARASGEGVMSVDTDSTSIEDWKKGTPTRVTATADPSQTATASTASTASTTTSTATSTATTTAEPPTPAPATTPAPTTTGTGTSTATTGTMTGTATSTATTTTPEPAPSQPSAPSPTTAPTTTAPEPSAAPQTAAPPMVSAPSAEPQPVGTSGRAESSELPRTASQMPAVGLIGLLALGGALVLRVARRSMA